MKKEVSSRINRTIGQLEALKLALNNDDFDCSKVIIQLKAILGSTKALGKFILEAEIDRCQKDNLPLDKSCEKLKEIIGIAF